MVNVDLVFMGAAAAAVSDTAIIAAGGILLREITPAPLFAQSGAVEALPDERALDALSDSTATIAAHFADGEIIADWLRQRRVPEAIIRRQLAATFALRCRVS